jgi:hypothetical protein
MWRTDETVENCVSFQVFVYWLRPRRPQLREVTSATSQSKGNRMAAARGDRDEQPAGRGKRA